MKLGTNIRKHNAVVYLSAKSIFKNFKSKDNSLLY